jgi:hypothetical protein
MHPSVGRVVHYVSHGTPLREDGTQAFASTCRAAVVTAVKDDTTVDLFVMNPTGVFLNQGCLFVGEGGPGYDAETGAYPSGTWHWPERVE